MLNAKSWPPTLKVTSWTSSPPRYWSRSYDPISQRVEIEDRHEPASTLRLGHTGRPRQRLAARHGKRLLAHHGVSVVYLERDLPAGGTELHEHDGTHAGRGDRRCFASRQECAQVYQRHETPA